MKELRKAFQDAQAFRDEEIAIRRALSASLSTRRYTSADRRALRRACYRRHAARLYAINEWARRRWAFVFAKHVFDRFRIRSDGSRLSEPVFLITLADRRYAISDDGSEAINLKSIAAWARQHLAGLSYIGMIEPAYYTNVGRYLGRYDRLISWHVHVLAWGVTK
jgi:hypothetical protein